MPKLQPLTICTDSETWTLHGNGDDMVLSYRLDLPDAPPVMSVPVSDDLLRALVVAREIGR